MDNNYTNNNNNNNTNLVLGILSAVFGALSLFIFCIPWLTLILAAAGLACGIIALIRIKKEGGQLTLPIIGTAISGVAFIVATVMVVTRQQIRRNGGLIQYHTRFYRPMGFQF